MKKIYYAFSFAIVMMYCITGISQTTIWSEDFTYSNGTITGQGVPQITSWVTDGYSSGGVDVRNNELRGKRTTNPNPDRTTWQIEASDPIEINGFTNVSITIDLREHDKLEPQDYIQVQFSLDGGAWADFAVNGYIADDFGNLVAEQTGLSGTNLLLRIIIVNDKEKHFADNILVTGIPAAPPVADFSANNLNPEVLQSVSFTDLSTNSPTSWEWSFSPSTITYVGGTDQYSKNPQVSFDATGLYSVTLTATNAYGSDLITKTDYIDVLPPSILMTSGTVTTCEGTFYDSGGASGDYSNNEDFEMTFYPAVTGNQMQFSFTSFHVQNATGGGFIRDYLSIYNGENTSAPLIGQYYGTNSPGTVTSTDATGALTFVFHSNNNQHFPGWAADITCMEPQVPVADFSADNLFPEVGQTVYFSDLSTNVPTSWTWTFNPSTVTYVGGTDQNSQNPQVQFNESGPYSVSLAVSNSAGADSEIKIEYILAMPPAIVMSDGTITTCEGTFYDSGGPTGNYSTGEDFTLTFYPAVAGNYIAITFNSFDIRDLYFGFILDYLEVYNGEDASAPLIGQYYGTNSPGTVNSTDLSGALTFVFHSVNWGGVPTGTGWEASITCNAPAPPIADFMADDTQPFTEQQVQFTDLSQNLPTFWAWSFSPATVTYLAGTNANSQNPQVSFNSTGLYTVSLTATNAYGNNSEVKTDYINVSDCSVATFPWSEDFENGGAMPDCWTQQFISGQFVEWQFLTGNGNTHPSTAHSGTYNACLIDEDSDDDQTILVSPKLDLADFNGATLTFWHTQEFWSPDQDELNLYYKTSQGGTWILLQSWTNDIGTWQQETIALPNLSDTYYIGFEGNAKWGYGVCIDDVEISILEPDPEMVWSGNVSTNWNTPGNWLSLEVPGSGNNVTIPDGLTNYPLISGDLNLGTECRNITMVGASLMTITGDLIIPAGYTFTCDAAARITLEGNWTNNGRFNAGISTVEFTGLSNSTISGAPMKSPGKSGKNIYLPSDNTSFPENAESDPNAKPVQHNASKAAWDLQFGYDVDNPSGQVGISGSETDGTYLYGTKWNGSGEIVKFDLDGNFIETFTIPGVINLRDLAYDGQYFYGSDAASYIWEMDFNTKTLISTLSTPAPVRGIAYDSENDAFWFNNWSEDLQLIDRSGTILNSITAPPSLYGCAYDNISADGPYLWIFTGTSVELGCYIEQFDLNTKTLTGVSHYVSADLGNYIAGGLWLQPNLINGTVTLGGLAQGTPDLIFGYDLIAKAQFYDVIDSKSNAAVIINNHTTFMHDVTVLPGAWLTNGNNYNSDVLGTLKLNSDGSGMSSLLDNGHLYCDNDARVELYLTPNQWHYVSTPVANTISGAFLGIYLRGFDETTDSWGEYITATDSSLSAMTGYAAWVAGDPATVTFSGELTSGQQNIPVTAQSTGTDVGWNFVGNPYPSYLDWDAEAGWNKGTVNNTIYYYSGVTGLGNYKYYQGAGGELPGIGVNGGTNEIPPMQGFFVHASGDGTLTVNDNARIHSGQSYYKSEKLAPPSMLKLAVENTDEITDETVIRFYENSTPEYDGNYDAYKLHANIQQLYSVTSGGTELAVNTLPECTNDLVINLGFLPAEEAAYTIKLSDFNSFEDGTKVYLEDILTGEIQTLTENPEYSFSATPEDDPLRFNLYFSLTTGVDDIDLSPVQIFAYDDYICVKNADNFTKAEIHISNLLGQEIYAKNISGKPISRIQLSTIPGIYMVWLKTDEGIFTEKVMLK